MQEQNLGSGHIYSVLIMNQLALVYMDQAKYSQAEPLLLRSIAILEHSLPSENLELAETADQYASLLRLMKRFDEAERWHGRAVAIRDAVASKAAKAHADPGPH